MSAEIVSSIVERWLEDPVNGVNAQLARVPVRAGDALPPELPKICGEFSDDWVALGKEPASFPCLLLEISRPTDNTQPGQLAPQATADRLTIDLTVVLRQSITARLLRQAHYMLDGAERSLRALFSQAAPPAAREERGVRLLRVDQIIVTPVGVSIGSLVVAASLRATLTLTRS